MTLDILLNIPRRLILFLLKAYKAVLSPLLPNACRFYPTCSSYTHDAILKHGVVKGGVLGLKRISRCHPFHPGGYDPVP